MKPRVVQHDHAAGRQHGQQYLFKINIHHLRVATAPQHQRRHQFVLPGSRDDTGAFPPFACDSLINPLAPQRASAFTIQAAIHAAFVQIEDGLAVERFQFASEEPPLDLVALAIGDEFFLE